MKSKATAHTPTPWNVMERPTLAHIETDCSNQYGAGIAVCSVPIAHKQDAAFIVRACNAHEELVAALTIAKTYGMSYFDPEDYARICSALAKAGAA